MAVSTAGNCRWWASSGSRAQSAPATRKQAWVTGSEKSPLGGDTALMRVTEPYRSGVPEAAHPPGALVELGGAAREVRRVALLAGHLLQARADLAQRLGPARQRVGHHRGAVAHVAEVLGDRQAEVDEASRAAMGMFEVLTTSTRAVDDRPARARIAQQGELVEHLRHLVAALPAADVDDDVGLGELGQRLLDHRLAVPKPPATATASSLGHGEEEVEDALTREKRLRRGDVARPLGRGRRTGQRCASPSQEPSCSSSATAVPACSFSPR